MAGGPHAAHVACPTCMFEHDRLVKATRVYEGVEDDHYVCDEGHQFGIDWSHGAPPSEPQWPPRAR